MPDEFEIRCLDTFPKWLATLATDGESLLAVIGDADAPADARKALAGGLNYLFRTLDLIPDGTDDIGYLDDAFILRVAAEHARAAGLGPNSGQHGAHVLHLAEDVVLVRDFLGDVHPRLETYVRGLQRGAARGRTVDDVVAGGSVFEEFAADVRGFARSFATPTFAKDTRNLIRLRAFFDAKLPR